MELNDIKAVCLVIFFLDTVLFGLLPYVIIKSTKSSRSKGFRATFLSYANCFAGGVFLGACLLHLMVEGRETLLEYFEHVSDLDNVWVTVRTRELP